MILKMKMGVFEIKISIIIPCYNSASNLPVVIENVKLEFEKHPEMIYEIILVNDNSNDNTFEIIKNICSKDPNIIGLDMSKNFGQSCATMAGIQYATGDVVVAMDDDGQHPVSGIFELSKKIIADNYDVAYAAFKDKKHSVFKRLVSNLHRKVGEFCGTIPRGIKISSFVAYSRFAADALKKYKSPFPSFAGYLSNITNRITNVELEHKERMSGASGYNIKKLFKLWLTTFTNFSMTPLRFAAFLGALLASFSFLIGFVSILRKLFDPDIVLGYTSIFVAILFVGGIIMILLGLIGEYIGRIYMTINNLQQFSIREKINYSEDD